MILKRYANPTKVGWFGWIESESDSKSDRECLGFVALHGAIIWKWELECRKGSRPNPITPGNSEEAMGHVPLSQEIADGDYVLDLMREKEEDYPRPDKDGGL